MSVPLDRLYNFLQTVCNQDIIIYRFFPHGSKKWGDCNPLYLPSVKEQLTAVPAVFHDQEPLTSDYIPAPYMTRFTNKLYDIDYNLSEPVGFFKKLLDIEHSPYKNVIVIHSEKNSKDVALLNEKNAIPVYYWSHAIIARDWFRYAEHDPSLNLSERSLPFLIYNRAWAGSREYRLKFCELLIEQDLHKFCNIKFSTEDNKKHYTKHKFINSSFTTQCKFEDFLPQNTSPSSASADYDSNDYNAANIEIVLETLFDETKWHLTEKTLRSIAVGKPFVLAATPGSLEYLRSYGFKTFSPWIDESYDNIQDPVLRLKAIIDIVKDFVRLDAGSKQEVLFHCQKIADYNKKLFFSDQFFQQVVNEYKTNIASAVETAKKVIDTECLEQWIAAQSKDIVAEAENYFPLALNKN